MNRLLCALALSVAAASANAATISIDPSSQSTTVGSTVSATVRIADLTTGTAPSLGGYDLNLSFDSAVLSFSGLTYGSGLDVLGLGSIRVSDTGSAALGLLNVVEISLDEESDLNALQTDAFGLFTVTFQALAAGTSGLSLQVNSLADAAGLGLNAATANGSIGVAPVPLPAAAWLLFSGLAGLAGISRRRSHGADNVAGDLAGARA
jgi:hypothetical protein